MTAFYPSSSHCTAMVQRLRIRAALEPRKTLRCALVLDRKHTRDPWFLPRCFRPALVRTSSSHVGAGARPCSLLLAWIGAWKRRKWRGTAVLFPGGHFFENFSRSPHIRGHKQQNTSAVAANTNTPQHRVNQQQLVRYCCTRQSATGPQQQC